MKDSSANQLPAKPAPGLIPADPGKQGAGRGAGISTCIAQGVMIITADWKTKLKLHHMSNPKNAENTKNKDQAVGASDFVTEAYNLEDEASMKQFYTRCRNRDIYEYLP
jgi:hypothetical protein